ncbi:MAG: tRNA uridine-5-carboxymethylaminomethyl(34) synthesis GTPase MnmE [Treponema sp.]
MANLKYIPEEPICAVATALAPAALGIVRASGKDCIQLFSRFFSRPKALLEAAGNTIVYGWIKDGEAKLDEALVSVFRAPKSFTGEDMVEISCHGGAGVVLAVYNLLIKNGFRQAQKGEFTFRAYLNRKADLTKAEAVREIIGSRTGEGQKRAAERLAGSLFDTVDGIKKRITATLAAIEVEIEYPEDEETIADAFDTAELQEAARALQELSDSWRGEKLYQDGVRLVLCGKTNAGKSSLFNAVLKEERAIVSDIEGTTRDWLESWADFSGIPVRLFDTAGLRRTDDAIEAKGVELTRTLSEEADVVLYLVDCIAGFTADDAEFLRACTQPAVLVWNKCDAAPPKSAGIKDEFSAVKEEVFLSAKTGAGLLQLYSAVKKILTDDSGVERRQQAGLGSERQKLCVDNALKSVQSALSAAEAALPLDTAVQDLEDALDSLGELTGEVRPDDILENIFSRFCVGK